MSLRTNILNIQEIDTNIKVKEINLKSNNLKHKFEKQPISYQNNWIMSKDKRANLTESPLAKNGII